MATQTTYKTTLDAGRPGHVADMRGSVIVSRTVDNTTLAFGVPVSQGTTDKSCHLTTTGDTNIIGFTVRDRSVAAGQDNYAQRDSAAIMTQGAIWATVTDAGGVVAGDDVWVKLSDGTLSNADVGSSGSIKATGCRWETSAANGGVAVIYVNTTIKATAGA